MNPTGQYDRSQTGPFGRIHEQSLRENRPEMYRALVEGGTLQEHLAEVDSAAQQEYESMLAALLKQHPPPTTALAKLQHIETIASQAREVVMESVIVPDEETEKARQSGGYR